ncbi:MAG: hypothetical protein RBS56_04740 [Candidatus Gracilibacteria bacterium]|jgi:hypothetical protein|nr:hypothetical protein [Candidatus Gracilibacteria bacterium]
MNLKKLFKTSGIVMTEALMAVTLMASAVIITGSIIESTVSTTKQTRDYAIAQNLSDEAISGVENIINSNKILYPNTPDCWLVYNIDECRPDTNTPDTISNYVVSLERGRWILENREKLALDLNIDSENNEEFRLFKQMKKLSEEDFPMYTHDNATKNEPSVYYRSVKFNEIETDSVSFTVTVQWKDRSIVRSIVDNVTLYKNY